MCVCVVCVCECFSIMLYYDLLLFVGNSTCCTVFKVIQIWSKRKMIKSVNLSNCCTHTHTHTHTISPKLSPDRHDNCFRRLCDTVLTVPCNEVLLIMLQCVPELCVNVCILHVVTPHTYIQLQQTHEQFFLAWLLTF